MSGLNLYLYNLFWNGHELPPSFSLLPALYADGIYAVLECIISQYISAAANGQLSISEWVDNTFSSNMAIQTMQIYFGSSSIAGD
jgi:hypothetical protein